ncbi:MAG TPA: addiction module protein [Thermoanaerobaculia bacterium]
MTATAQALREAVLNLPDEDRAWLAAELLASLDGPSDPDAEAEWRAEIERRVEEIESGAVELLDWDIVKARLDEKLANLEPKNPDRSPGSARAHRCGRVVRGRAQRPGS